MLLAFTAESPRLQIEDLVKIASTPKSSAYRHLAVLRDMGLVEDDGQGTYQLTTRIAALAAASRAANGLLDIARPVMERLRNQSRETVLLYKRTRDTAVCVELIESIDPIRLSSSVGVTLPLHRGAGARVLLAYMPPASLEAYRAKTKLRGSARIVDADLEKIRLDGFAVSEAELSPDVWAAAAPVEESGNVRHSLTVAGPAYRLDENRQRQLKTYLIKAARQLSRVLSG